MAAAGGALVLTTAQAPAEQAFVTLDGDLKKEAWWAVADFHPFTTEVRGIPANQIRKSWCKATEFRKDLIPKELLFEGSADVMKAAGMSFAIEGRFDGTATLQVAVVGVFQECAGPKGRFFLILDQPAGGTPRIRFVDAVRTNRQFGALQKGQGGSIVAWECMECDGSSVLKWDRKKRKFGWVPQPEEQ
ncbi:hypothetical protein [Bradyrhizobium neotropicale]|uniref:hypothetical protein n=1 Tax=Bradyrhizobium neotropicale TaxID=1497615 RepID=UPI0009EE8421|nr:hypothetical protein [Bradyrhizobium neotropicale]